AGDGRGRRVLPAARGAASHVSHADGGDSRAGGVVHRADAEQQVRPARGLRRLRRLDFLRAHGGGTVRVSHPRPARRGDAARGRVPRAGLSLHAGVVRRGGGTRGRELGGFKSEERDDRDRVAVVGRAGVLVLENAPNNTSVDRIFMSRARNTNALDERGGRGHASVALASRAFFLATASRPFVV